MSKIPCDVIKDLLPLYADNVCSEHSKDIVEEHLTECEDCREYYEAMTEKLPEISGKDVSAGSEDEFLTYVKRKLTYQKLLIAGVVFFVVLLIPVLYERMNSSYMQTESSLFDKRLETKDVQVTELYELKDGSIYFTLESNRKASGFTHSEIILPKDSTANSTEDGYRTVTLTDSFWDIFTSTLRFQKASSVLTLSQQNLDSDSSAAMKHCSAIYYEGKRNERKTIWKEGQDIEPAPEYIEQQATEYKKSASNDALDDGETYLKIYE